MTRIRLRARNKSNRGLRDARMKQGLERQERKHHMYSDDTDRAKVKKQENRPPHIDPYRETPTTEVPDCSRGAFSELLVKDLSAAY
jgi:hypothetical protein